MARRCMNPVTKQSKIRYRDEIAAKIALAVLWRQDKPGHNEQRTYRCGLCRGYHLTSKELVEHK